MKSYTDIKQSRKLAEFLPIESADMYYPYDLDSRKILNIPVVKDDYCMPCIHCWSLAALLSVLPDYTMQTNTDGKVFVVCESKKPMVYAYDNPVDACVEMIEKLHELNLL